MRILDWTSLDEAGRRAALARPSREARAGVERLARDVIARVRRDGDAALRTLTKRFDGVELDRFAVGPGEFSVARNSLSRAQLAALERAIANIQRFHQAQAPKPLLVETEAGVRCEQIIRPIPSVGLYVPAGTAPLPSAVVMLGVPSRIAGVPRRILCTPPQRDGLVHPAVLMAAELCGINEVFKVGGAQAIAALAFGTESIPRVDKIFGPGNAWVTAAKTLVASDPEGAACDLPAGPSEVLIVADETAECELVAADLLAQAEHDSFAQTILVTHNRALIERLIGEIARQRAALSRGAILDESLSSCRLILVPDLETAICVVNLYAPEHLMLEVRDSRRWLHEVQNAGSIFLGPWSAEPFGDYCAGPNHVLPTDGHARTVSGL
ncbi:MAG TPA: histidinol dehydrogenase, partial [Steroidobacteraceae bacterium]|nr:histidinol dehydrogenase [Steroidobacteraceae bacterium]